MKPDIFSFIEKHNLNDAVDDKVFMMLSVYFVFIKKFDWKSLER